ncbi:hypothetical protein H0H93_011582, partial [Arthromyces matolae]
CTLTERQNHSLREQNERLQKKLSRQEEELQLNHEKSVNKIGNLQGRVQRLLAENQTLQNDFQDQSQKWLEEHQARETAEGLLKDERAHCQRQSGLAAALERATANNDNKSLEGLEQYIVSIRVDHFIRSLIKVSKEMEKELQTVQREMRLNVEKNKALQERVDELEGRENKKERLEENLEELTTADTQDSKAKYDQLKTLLDRERAMGLDRHNKHVEAEERCRKSLSAFQAQVSDQARKLETLKAEATQTKYSHDETAIRTANELAEKDKQISALTRQTKMLSCAKDGDVNSLVHKYEGQLKELQVERDELSRQGGEMENRVNELCKEKEAEAERFRELEQQVHGERGRVQELENQVFEKEAEAQRCRDRVSELEQNLEGERGKVQELEYQAIGKEAEAERLRELEQQVHGERGRVQELENQVFEKEAEAQRCRDRVSELEQ